MMSRVPMTSIRFEHEVRSLERELLFQREVAQSLIERHASAVLGSAGLLHHKLSCAIHLWSETCRTLREEADVRRRELLSSLSAHEERLLRTLREVENDRNLEASWSKQKLMMEAADELRSAARERQLELAESRATDAALQRRREMSAATEAIEASWETLAKAVDQLETRVDALDKRETALVARERAVAQRSVGTILRRGRDVTQCIVCEGGAWTVDKVGQHRLLCFEGTTLNLTLTLPRCDLALYEVTCTASFDSCAQETVLVDAGTGSAEIVEHDGPQRSSSRRSSSPPDDDSALVVLRFHGVRLSSDRLTQHVRGPTPVPFDRGVAPSPNDPHPRRPLLAKVLIVCTPRAQPLDYAEFEVLPIVYEIDVVQLRPPFLVLEDGHLGGGASCPLLLNGGQVSDHPLGVSVSREDSGAIINVIVDVADAPDPFFVRRYWLQRAPQQNDSNGLVDDGHVSKSRQNNNLFPLETVTSTTKFRQRRITTEDSNASTVVATRLHLRSHPGADAEDIAAAASPESSWRLLVEVAGVNEPYLVGYVTTLGPLTLAAAAVATEPHVSTASGEREGGGAPDAQLNENVEDVRQVRDPPPPPSSVATAADIPADECGGWRLLYNAAHRTAVYWNPRSGVVRYYWSGHDGSPPPSLASPPSAAGSTPLPHPNDVTFRSRTSVLPIPPVVGPFCLWTPDGADMLCLVAVTMLSSTSPIAEDESHAVAESHISGGCGGADGEVAQHPQQQQLLVVSIDEQEIVFSCALPCPGLVGSGAGILGAAAADGASESLPDMTVDKETIVRILVPEDGSPFLALITSTARVFQLNLGATWSLVSVPVPEDAATRYLLLLHSGQEDGAAECVRLDSRDGYPSIVLLTAQADDDSSAPPLRVPLLPPSSY